MNLYLAIDQGSHASRAVLFDENGAEIARASCPLVIECDEPGRAQYEAGRVLASVGSALQQVIEAVSDDSGNRVLACGIAVQRSTVLAWNAEGVPLSPVVSWSDVRAASRVQELSEHARRIRAISDLPLSAYYGASKLAWLLHNEPAVKNCDPGTLRLSPLASYLIYMLLDNHPYVVDHSIAQRTQLMDSSSLDWSPELALLFGIPVAALPQCVPMIGMFGNLIGTTIPVTAVCGDQNAAFYGMGSCDEHSVIVNIGSGAFVLHSPSEKPDTDGELLCGIAYSDAKTVSYMNEATVNGAGNALEWLQQHYGIEHLYERLPEWLQEIDHPPVFINAVGGLGTPWMRDDIAPFFIDDEDAGDAERAVAVVESIAFLLAYNIDRMDDGLQRILISGGLSKLVGLCTRLSSLAGIPVERGAYHETTARGVAWLASGCSDGWGDTDNREQFMPEDNAGLQARYRLFIDSLQQVLES